MSKAYDRLEWSFLRKTLLHYGFNSTWVDRVMFCVESPQLAILLNGSPLNFFTPSRGLRQGDPLSSYLFVLCEEVLSSHLAIALQQQIIHGIKISRHSEAISHMAFADDLILFGRATIQEARVFQSILEAYCARSGQSLNVNQTRAQFSPNVPSSLKRQLHERFKIIPTSRLDTYLGIPFVAGKLSKSHCQDLLHRVNSKLSGWKAKYLSSAGKHTLIQSTLSAMPQYFMSCFQLPSSVLKDLDSSSRKSFWSSGDKSLVPTISWHSICRTKKSGGLNLRLSTNMNLSLLAKKAWELLSPSDSLWGRLMKAKYFPSCDFLHATCPRNASWGWKSVFKARDLLFKGLFIRVGHGRSINPWIDPWIPRLPPSLAPYLLPPDAPSSVADFIDPATRTWKASVVRFWWPPEHADAILSIPLSIHEEEV
ncbi:uncharacterized protein LOC122091540 [Macadamia integrifolia]|uniref:uncharacterized protein LOC122067076 n=1 Tax=Macadamia integrifolia TaxID=60698 RepID=UPI001C4F0979|nr:uncharacterized protein LOC122067076 [Macadamia integrifolia]XP_042517489.1 uncharacterized protein LOC122091540 [Macadamia integrifolia]